MTVVFENKTYILDQEPYYSNGTSDCYMALAHDDEGNKYTIYWKIVNEEAEMLEDTCDWENPSYIEKED